MTKDTDQVRIPADSNNETWETNSPFAVMTKAIHKVMTESEFPLQLHVTGHTWMFRTALDRRRANPLKRLNFCLPWLPGVCQHSVGKCDG